MGFPLTRPDAPPESICEAFGPYRREGKEKGDTPMTTAWIVLVIAGLFETGWAIGLKYTDNFTKLVPSVLTLVSMAISVYMLSWSLKSLPVGTGYAVWTGIGSLCTAILGIYLFGESMAPARIVCLALIVAGIVGLKIVS